MSARQMEIAKKAWSIALAGILASKVFANEIEIISTSGDQVDPAASLSYKGYSNPQINDREEIAFAADFDEVSPTGGLKFEGVSLYSDGELTLIANTGGTAPLPGSDGTFHSLSAPKLLESGRLLVRGYINGSSSAKTRFGIWAADKDGDSLASHLLARSGEQAIVDYASGIDNGRYEYLSNPFPTPGDRFAFFSDLYSGSFDEASGLWLQTAQTASSSAVPEPHLLALSELELPGGNETVETPLNYVGIDIDSGVLLARLEESETVDSANKLGLWQIDTPNTLTQLVRSGEIAPDSSDAFASFGQPAYSNGAIYFWASLLNTEETEGVYAISDGLVSRIASTDERLIDGNGPLAVKSFFDPQTNSEGDIALLAELESGEHAILLRSVAGTWSLIAKTGDQATGAVWGTTLDRLSIPILNDRGQIAFSATLSGDEETISDTTDFGIWITDTNGVLNLIIREGDTLEIAAGEFRTVAAVELGGFNASGNLALRSVFTDETEAVLHISSQNIHVPKITSQPASQTPISGETIEIGLQVDGQGPFSYSWYKDNVVISGESAATLSLSNIAESDSGRYHAIISNAAGSANSAFATVSVLENGEVPVFTEQPLPQIILIGETIALSSNATASNEVSYQWFKNEVPIPNATRKSLTITEARSDDEGTYYVIAATESASTKSLNTDVFVTDKRLINISTRAKVGTGLNVLNSGFVISGPEPKQILIRGIGPSLAIFDISNVLEEPLIELKSGTHVIHSNKGWNASADQDAIAAAGNLVGAFDIPTDSEDAALLVTLDPGKYTAALKGEGATTGIGLIEVYEIGTDLTRLSNISSRAFVGTGIEAAVPGVTVEGDLPTTVVVRAVGPGLEGFGISGVLARPILEIRNSLGDTIATNERWHESADPDSLAEAFAKVGAFEFEDFSEDAALLIELEPGIYSIRVRGEDGTSGIALVEFYTLP